VVLLFRPDDFMDRITSEFDDVPAARIFDVGKATDDNELAMVVIKSSTIEGDEVVKTVALQLGAAGAEGRNRLTEAGLTVVPLGGQVQIAQVKLGSRAQKSRFEQSWDIPAVKVPTERPTANWSYLPALLLRVGVVESGAAVARPDGKSLKFGGRLGGDCTVGLVSLRRKSRVPCPASTDPKARDRYAGAGTSHN